MTQGAPRLSDDAAQELLEDADGLGPRVITVAVAPISRVRSPLMEHRSFAPLPPDEDRPALLLPPLRALVGPSRFALLVALPLLLLVTWQAALVGAVVAAAARELRCRADRMTFSFGEGFLPYRSQAGWPLGVQEDDDVRWNWTPAGSGGAQG